MPTEFMECATCAAKPGIPVLCPGCLNNRAVIQELESKVASFVPGTHPDFLTRLRTVNLARMPRFGHGEISAPGGWSPMKWGCALAGEVGELCNLLKKYERQMPTDPDQDELHAEIAYEFADVFIYGDLGAAYFDLSLPHIIETKFNRTSRKFGFPERL